VRPAAFLDRDNTITEGGTVNTPEEYEAKPFREGAVEALQLLQAKGYALIVVSNQGGVGLGYMTDSALCAQHLVLFDRLAREGVHLTSIRCCHHRPDAGCECRKPKPGLILEQARKFNIHLPSSVMIGDMQTDVEAGVAAGVGRNYLLESWPKFDLGRPTRVASALDASPE